MLNAAPISSYVMPIPLHKLLAFLFFPLSSSLKHSVKTHFCFCAEHIANSSKSSSETSCFERVHLSVQATFKASAKYGSVCFGL